MYIKLAMLGVALMPFYPNPVHCGAVCTQNHTRGPAVVHIPAPATTIVRPGNCARRWVPGHYVNCTVRDGTMVRVWVPGGFQ